MIFMPVVLNSIQYWIQDNYIKADDSELETSLMEQMKDTLVSYTEEDTTVHDNPELTPNNRGVKHVHSINNDELFIIENEMLYEGLLK
jgi:hypothetical protein